MSDVTAKSSLLSVLSGPPQSVAERNVLLSTVFLSTLLVAGVPLLAVSIGVPTLGLVAAAGVLYAAVLVFTDTVFEGLCGAVFVLVTFAANIPLIELPMGGGGYTTPMLEVLMVDVVVVPFAGLICWWLYAGKLSLSFGREKIAGYALAGLVGWSLLAALVAHGPSRLAALFYVVGHLRYLLLFAVGAVVVRYIGIHTTIYSLCIAIFAQLAYAIVEVLYREPIGLTRLGDGVGGFISVFSVGPLLFKTSLSAGGFTGTSRVLATVLLLVVPILLVIIVRRSPPWKLVAAVTLVASIFLFRVSKSDSAFGALLITTFSAGVALCVFWRTTDPAGRTVRYKTADYVFGFASSIGSIFLAVFLFSRPNIVKGNAGSRAISTANLSDRIQQYVAALDIGFHYPLFGIGGMNFPLVAESYGLPDPIAIHNSYLSVLASTGIPGAILFLVSIGTVFVVAGGMALSTETDRLFWAMLVCGMLGFHAYNFWTTGGEVTYLVFWVLAGAIVGARRHKQHTGETSRSATPAR